MMMMMMMVIIIIIIMIACVAGGFLVCFSAQYFCPWFSFYVAVSLTL